MRRAIRKGHKGGVPFAQHVFQPSMKVAAITTTTPIVLPSRPVVGMADQGAIVAQLSQTTGVCYYGTGHTQIRRI